MSQSLRERIEGLRPVVSWGTPAHDLVDKADVLRFIAEHEREQAAVAMGVRLVKVCAPACKECLQSMDHDGGPDYSCDRCSTKTTLTTDGERGM